MAKEDYLLYRHRSIRAYSVGRFRFKNFEVRVAPDDQEEFESLIRSLGDVKAGAISRIDRDAEDRSSIPLTTVRGAFSVGDLLTQKDRERLLAETQRLQAEQAGKDPASEDEGKGTPSASHSSTPQINISNLSNMLKK